MVRPVLIVWNAAAPIALAAMWMAGHFWCGLAMLFGGHALALWATLWPGCTWWGPQRSGFVTQSKEVWLTIDDGPDPRDTPVIVEALARHGARATFFVIGEKARRHPELIRMIRDGGHGIGNHTLSHPHWRFWRLGPGALEAEVDGGAKAIAAAGGGEMRLFRAPAGMRNCFLHPVLRRRGLELVGWTVRGFDGVTAEAGAVVKRVVCGARPGAIVLLHESHLGKDGRPLAERCVPQVLAELSARGYRFVIPPMNRSSR